MSQVPSAAISSTNLETIFTAALKAYKRQTKKDIASHPLATQLQSCDSPSAILAVLRTQVQTFDQSQSASERWTKWLDPTVNVLHAFSVTLGDGVGLIFPPSNATFAGIGVLLQAVKDVRADQDTLIDLFGCMEYFFKRLEAYIEVRPTATMTDTIAKIMAEVLLVLGIVTKEVVQGRTKKYLKRLIGRKDVEEALQRLDRLTQEEARMAATEALKITCSIDNSVKDMDKKMEGISHKVGSVIRGVKGIGVAIQQVGNQVTNLNRNELRKDLRKWVAPPDPSVNYLDHNADTHARSNKGNTPLHVAADKGHLKVAQILLERNVEANSRNNNSRTPLHLASLNGHPDVVQLLLDHDVGVHVRDNKGDTPLHLAADRGHLKVAQILLERNVEVNSRNDNSRTPLLLASNGHPDVVQLLLDHNADTHVRSNKGNTPLHVAADKGHLEVAQILLGRNVEANSRNDKGLTPLLLASQNGHPDIVQVLLNYGADVQVRNLSGKTASEVARGSRQQEIVQSLSQHAAECTNETG